MEIHESLLAEQRSKELYDLANKAAAQGRIEEARLRAVEAAQAYPPNRSAQDYACFLELVAGNYIESLQYWSGSEAREYLVWDGVHAHLALLLYGLGGPQAAVAILEETFQTKRALGSADKTMVPLSLFAFNLAVLESDNLEVPQWQRNDPRKHPVGDVVDVFRRYLMNSKGVKTSPRKPIVDYICYEAEWGNVKLVDTNRSFEDARVQFDWDTTILIHDYVIAADMSAEEKLRRIVADVRALKTMDSLALLLAVHFDRKDKR